MRKIYRSRYNKKIAGICGGLGNYFSIDPVFIRLLYVFFMIATAFFPFLLAYLIASLIIPLEPAGSPAIEIKHLLRSKRDRVIAGICGGLSKNLKMDSTILRLIFVAIAAVTAFVPMLITYLIGWVIIPEEKL